MARAWKVLIFASATGLLAALPVVAVPATGFARADAAVPLLPPAAALAEGPGQQRVIEAVEQRYRAKVVRVTETTVNGKAALELRLLSEQRVWDVVVDAQTGQDLPRH